MRKMFPGRRRKVALCLCAALLYGGTAAAQRPGPPTAPPSPAAALSLQFQPDGVSGTCEVNGETASFDAKRLSKDSSRSRLRRQDGRSLVEVLRDKDAVEISFPGVRVKVDVAAQTFVGLTEEDREKLQSFLRSSEASLARKCITGLIQSKAQTDARKFVPVGFILAGMLLGEEPPPAGESRNNAEPLHRLLLTHYGIQPPALAARASLPCPPAAPAKARKTAFVRATYQDNCPDPTDGCFGGSECNGCCGVGCSSCTGYYTYECLAHDNCVNRYGHVACLGLFPAAASSLLRAIEKGRGDWPPEDTWLLVM